MLKFLIRVAILAYSVSAFAGSPVIWPGTVLSSQILAKDGTQAAPAYSFTSEAGTGMYRVGALDLAFSVANHKAFDILENSGFLTFGIGGAANTNVDYPVTMTTIDNADVYYQGLNTSTGTSASVNFNFAAGTASGEYIMLSTYRDQYLPNSYLAEKGYIHAGFNQLALVLGSEYSAGQIQFNIGGAGTTHEYLNLGTTALTTKLGISMIHNGATSGALTESYPAAITSYAITWPSAQAAGALTNDGSGNLSWTPAAGTGTVTSVGMTVPSFLSISGSPVTTSGTLALTLSGTALPVANGGTGATSVTTTPGATAFAGWDSNVNLSANNMLQTATSISAAAGTTTLTVASAATQIVTGSGGQTIKLPVASTLALGTTYTIINNQTNGVSTVPIQSSGANTICTLAGTSGASTYASATLTLVLTSGTTAASWICTVNTQAFSGSSSSLTLPKGFGGTGVTAVTTAPAASAFAGWDANLGFEARAFSTDLTSTATAAGTTTMTIASNGIQVWTGSSAQTIKLPTTSVKAGTTYRFINLSSSSLSIQSSGANAISTVTTNTRQDCTALVATPTAAADWSCL